MAPPTIKSQDEAARVASAIVDCDKYIAKVGGNCANMSPQGTLELLDFYVAHRDNLSASLAAYSASIGLGS